MARSKEGYNDLKGIVRQFLYAKGDLLNFRYTIVNIIAVDITCECEPINYPQYT